MNKSPFDRLTPELRTRIYKLIFPQSSLVHIYYDFSKSTAGKKPALAIEGGKPQAFALLHTCRKIQSESLPILYSCNRLLIHTVDHKWHGGSVTPTIRLSTLESILDRVSKAKPGKLAIVANMGLFDIGDVLHGDIGHFLKNCLKCIQLHVSGRCYLQFKIHYFNSTPPGPLKMINLGIDSLDLRRSYQAIVRRLEQEAMNEPGGRLHLLQARGGFRSLLRVD